MSGKITSHAVDEQQRSEIKMVLVRNKALRERLMEKCEKYRKNDKAIKPNRNVRPVNNISQRSRTYDLP
jgi:hypothetical protein